MLNKTKTKLQIFDDEDRSYNFETLDKEEIISNQTVMLNNSIIGQHGIGIWVDYPKKKFKLPEIKFQHVLNPIQFFKDIKTNLLTINKDTLIKEIDSVNIIINDALEIKQKALLQQLEKEKERIYRELVLSHLNYKYLDEEDILNFCKKEPKDIRLDWIKNFSRVIPEKSTKLIKDALLISINDERVFDNIVIMHYDPKNTGSKLTEKEKEKKRDPIAFGVMKCSTRLYFITDWIDEYCDLTLKKVLSKINMKEKAFNLMEEFKSIGDK